MEKPMSTVVPATGAVLALLALLLAPTPALGSTSESSEPPPAAINNPEVPRDLIDALPEIVQQSPDVIVDPDLVLGPVVYPDGTPVEGQSASQVREARARCGGTATAMLAVYGPESVGTCLVFGHAGYRQGYAWGVQNPQGGVCTQGRGFNASGTRTWYAIGCGKSSSGTTVPWGNMLSNPSVRALSNAAPLLNSVGWWV
jgi:hypothetical protein